MYKLSSKTEMSSMDARLKKEKSRKVYFAMLKHNNPELHSAIREGWLVKNKEHVKVYHRTNQRKNRAVKQVASDRARALRHLAKAIKLKLIALGETLDTKTLARFNRAVLQQ